MNCIIRKLGYFTFIIVMLTIAMSSCNSESKDDGQQDYRLTASASILSEVNANRPNWNIAEKTEGPVDIIVEDSLISIRHDAYASEEIVTYYLQTDKKIKKLKSSRIEIAEVIYLEKSLIVNSITDKNTLFFSLNTVSSPDYLETMKGVKTYLGFGLAARKVTKGMLSVNAYYCDCVPAGYPEGGCPKSDALSLDCTASNEHGSCKVFCTGQTFACCGKRGQ